MRHYELNEVDCNPHPVVNSRPNALRELGIAVLTHTPSPMGFFNELLGRPAHERAFVLLVAGYPAPAARVPDIARKALDVIASFR